MKVSILPTLFSPNCPFYLEGQLAKKTDKTVISHISPLMNLGIDQQQKKKKIEKKGYAYKIFKILF